ncbi:TPA: hypothetical protein JBJ85_15445 [Legionella pneumophila]|nr:hypothetical protein [Legionella pneumophila]HAU1562894.1 hypothetical protein [Legionella pneumophila]HAU1860266.1 hypothetical protein [Legionella pneumophila]
MAHIKNYLPSNEEELNQIVIKKIIDATPFKIGDYVKILTHDADEKWIISDFSVTADGEPAALLESDTWHTFALLQDVQFYHH